MIAVFERLFGHPYPYAKYDQVVVSDFIFGGMENTSATTLYEYAMLDETVEGAIDRDDLVAHELAHQWFGDLLTCRDWAHAWLNEGFATLRGGPLVRARRVARARDLAPPPDGAAVLRRVAGTTTRGPIVTHAFEAPSDIFDRHLYDKAACVLHHLRLELGDEVFFRALRGYVTAHARGLVETLDFRRACEAECGRNLEPFFEQWIHRPGHPELEVSHAWDEATRRLTLSVKQTQEGAEDRPWRFRLPCRVYLARLEPAFVERTFEVTAARALLRLGCSRTILPASASVRAGCPSSAIKFPRLDPLLARQLEDDEDLLGRSEAARQLGKSGTEHAVAALARQLLAERTWMGQAEIARALGEARGPRRARRSSRVSPSRTPGPAPPSPGRWGDSARTSSRPRRSASLLEREREAVVRAAAYRALGGTRAASAPAALTQGLWERGWNEIIGRACLDGLGNLRDRTLIPLFVNSLRYGEHELRRVAAVDALRETAQAIEVKTPIREQLEHLVEDRSYRVAQAAVHGLKSLGDPGSVPALERLASRRYADTRLRRIARSAIKSIQDAKSHAGSAGGSDRMERLEDQVRKLRDRLAALEQPSLPAAAVPPPRRRAKPKKRAQPRARAKPRRPGKKRRR